MNRNRPYLIISFLTLLVAGLSAGVLLNGCKNKVEAQYTLTGDTVIDGKNLAQINCTKCHALVPPNLLSKNVWKFHTMPDMAPYLGVTSYLDGYFKKDTSGISLLEWRIITSYYQKMAPDTLLAAKPPVQPINDWAGFTLKLPKQESNTVYTTLAAVNPNNHKIYTGDGVSATLKEWGSNLQLERTVALPSPAVHASFVKSDKDAGNVMLSCIGQIAPMDFPSGKVMSVNLADANLSPAVFQSELQRPVQTLSADFNKDGLMDWVICGQGGKKGAVSLVKQNADHSVSQQDIINKAGAVKAVTGDFNKDGWPDLMVLFGSADESLIMFLNDQHGGFTQKKLLSFPPVYGSTDFELVDLDHDGNIDLIYTCGFNYNDSRILKPYHGLYLYKNTGDWKFKQQWFYPVNGLTRFGTADFNGDGKLDIMTTAFFADEQTNPAEGCIYFEQDTPFSFKPHMIPVSKYGRWMTMDIGDYNNDGKPDVILGNYSKGFYFQLSLKSFWDTSLPFIVLQNNFKK